MKQKEQELITYLADMGQCLYSHDDWWSEKFKEDSIQAQNLFNRDAELKDKYDFVRRVFSYYYSNFDITPDGQQVKLIPNKVIYQRPDYPPTIVPDTEEVTKQVWSVLKCQGPDITNMPSYHIKCIKGGSAWQSARQEALEILANTNSASRE